MAHYVKKNGVLTPLNGRSAQDYLEAKGRIVVDIYNQQVGDVIRVRSLLDPTQVWNKEITELGDYMVFDVPCKDIYAICLVQDVSGTPTEIIEIDKSVDYGQTLLVKVYDKKSLAGFQAILDAHSESVINIGDELEVEGQIYQVGGVNLYASHEVIFVSKYLQGNTYWASSGSYTYSDSVCTLRTSIESIYSNWSQDSKNFVKPKIVRQDAVGLNYGAYLWAPTGYEIYGQGTYQYNNDSNGNTQFPIFMAQQNRVRSQEGASTAQSWWAASRSSYDTGYTLVHTSEAGVQGAVSNGYASYRLGILPCFHLTADI